MRVVNNTESNRLFGWLCLAAAVLPLSGCNHKEDCKFDQTLIGLEGAVSANAGCIVIHRGKMLAIQSLRGKLSIPGGSSDNDESASCTAIRETLQETGLRIRPEKLESVWPNDFHMYSCRLEGVAANTTDKPSTSIRRPLEVKAIMWLGPEDFDKHPWRYPDQKEWLFQFLLNHPAPSTDRNQKR